MLSAALIVVAVPSVLAVFGALILVWGVRTLRRGQGPVPGMLRVVAGAGVLLSMPLSVLMLSSNMNYGVIIVPTLWILIATVWAVVFLRAAAPFAWLRRRRREVAR